MIQPTDLPEEIRKFYASANISLVKILKLGEVFTRKFKVHRSDGKHDVWRKHLGHWRKIIDSVDDDLASKKNEATLIRFKYDDGTDTTPFVLVLAQYQHNKTDTCLVCGINLHYLGPKSNAQLMAGLPDLLYEEDGSKRYRYGLQHMPEIFRNAYRTYDERMMSHISRSRITVQKA